MVELHVVFFPYMAHGHMIPTLDMAKLFSSRGVKTTIITTPLNAPVFSKSIQRSNQLGLDISLKIFDFPAVAVGLPEGCENADRITSTEMVPKFFAATVLLREPLEQLLSDHRPDCLVTDIFFPWATEAAAKLDIPRLIFHGISFFALCAGEAMTTHKPFRQVTSDSEPFILPELPHEIKLTRTEVSPFDLYDTESDISIIVKQVRESEKTCFGIIANTFYALEPDYADHYRNVMGRTAWHVGPLSLSATEDSRTKQIEEKKLPSTNVNVFNGLIQRNPNPSSTSVSEAWPNSPIPNCTKSLPVLNPPANSSSGW